MPSDPDSPVLRVAAILDEGHADTDADALLARLVVRQQAAGRRVHGLLMTRPEGRGGCGTMVLVDIATQDNYLVSQPMGSGSSSCRADPQGFARASRVLRDALAAAPAPDLVVCNRFGGLEAEGGGFRDELLALMLRGVPLLTVVATRHLPAWQQFSGLATVLPADEAEVQDWLTRCMSPSPATAPHP